MERKLNLTEGNSLEFEIVKDNSKERTWYFVNWSYDEIDENGNYTIYTKHDTFGERIAIFKSNNWSITCKVGNMINGLFHRYFSISNSYPLSPLVNLDMLLKQMP